jgi:hypothetical protein
MNVKILTIFLLISCSLAFGQRARIVTESVTPHQLETLGLTTESVSAGLHVVPNETYVYLAPENIANTQPITAAVFEIISKPAGSNAVLEPSFDNWMQLRPDVKGEYRIKLTITTSGGTHDTTQSIFAANYVGVGNFEGQPAVYPNCMTCHQNTPKFQQIFERWNVSGHATAFKRKINDPTGHFGENCIKCHTTGYDHNIEANNNGFDDIAAALGWEWQGPPNPGKWDSLKTDFPGLVQFATIGCESCHGPGGEHAMGGNPGKIAVSLEAGVCGQCHDEPWRHNKYSEWENSLHSEAVWSNSFAQGAASQNNNLQNCIRCHGGDGFVNFTKGVTTNTTGMISANHAKISCATCHDPHGNSNHASIRFTPEGSDTLGSGFKYGTDFGGTGNLCMNCHKTRRNAEIYTQTPPNNANWGPHYSNQADILLGENAANFGTPYLSSPHKFAIENTCVTCHMVATVDTGHVSRDRVGGHSMALYDAENDYYHTAACVSCHGQRDSWDDFIARGDYDGNGVVESIPAEIHGLETALRIQLPPVGIDSVAWQDVQAANDINITKAYYNYRIMGYDKSQGMHNTMYAVDVLQQSIVAAGGTISNVITDDTVIPDEFTVSQNYPNPFNPNTTIRYTLPFESSIKISIYSITGELIKELVNDVRLAGTYEANFNAQSAGKALASGVYFYTIEANSVTGGKFFRESKKMILMK